MALERFSKEVLERCWRGPGEVLERYGRGTGEVLERSVQVVRGCPEISRGPVEVVFLVWKSLWLRSGC